MRGPDSDPQGPDIAGALMAVDATLAGDPVDPQYAELAELALILRGERPRTSDAFTARLDAQVQRRFARPAPAVRGTGLRRWLGGSLAGLTAAAAGVAVVLVLAGGHGGGSSNSSSAAAGTVVSSASASASHSAGAAAGKPLLGVTPAIREAKRPTAAAAATATSSSSSAASSAPGSVIPSPVIPGTRQVVQSAQLVLGVVPKRIDDVSQQVFNVVGQEKGYVTGSNVTSGGGDGGASFQLSVPSANLAATLTSLSQLRGAHVMSRTDNTNDITGQVGGAVRMAFPASPDGD